MAYDLTGRSPTIRGGRQWNADEQQKPSARKRVLVQQIVRGRLPEPAAFRRARWAEFLRPDVVRANALLFGREGSEEDRAPHVLTRFLRVDLR